MQTTIVIDSDVTLAEALTQNPKSPAPREVLDALQMNEVIYLGFDNALHKGQIVMHADVSDDIRSFFTFALELKFPIHSVIPISNSRYAWDDETSCNANNSSGFNYRTITGNPHKISKHAYGLAFDVNPVQNIYVRYNEQLEIVFKSPADGIYDERAIGTLTRDHLLVQYMKKRGWEWGGDWLPEGGRVDYQHFEKDIR